MDPRVIELQCIMPIGNVQSVLQHGLLSYERAALLQHHSIALQPVQDKRDQTQVPRGLRLHQYANLYFHARNPMLYKRLGEADEICVLKIAREVLDIQGTVISDQNAASDYVRFLAPSQWQLLDFESIFARDWRDVDKIRYWQKKSKKCAEVLVPHRVPPHLIRGAYVASQTANTRFSALGVAIASTIDADMFFG